MFGGQSPRALRRDCTCTVPEWGIYITQNPDIVVDYQDDDQVPNDTQCTWGDWAAWSACDCNAMTMEATRQATNADCSQAYDSRFVNHSPATT